MAPDGAIFCEKGESGRLAGAAATAAAARLLSGDADEDLKEKIYR
jgi:hypothetical protein